MQVVKDRFRLIVRARAMVLQITLTEVAKRMGISRQHLNSIVRDMRMSLPYMIKIAEALEWRFIDLAQAIDHGCIIEKHSVVDPDSVSRGPDYIENILDSAIGGILAGNSGVIPAKRSGRRPRLRSVSSRDPL